MADDARAALRAIDPGLPREDWVRVAMAAKSAGLTLEDFDRWSAEAPNYGGRTDTAAVWRSIKPEGGVTEKTLFAMAREAGWRPKKNGHPRLNGHARLDVAQVWSSCEPATEAHPYIQRKRGLSDGLRVVPKKSSLRIAGKSVAGWLAVPVEDLDGGLCTIQFISPDGEKLSLPGASFGSGMFLVGDLAETDRCYIVEGIGQAWVCWRATGKAAACTFGAGRFRAVAEALRHRYPDLRLVLVPDRGKEPQAEALARELGCELARMPANVPRNFDANDYLLEHGAEALAELLERTERPERAEPEQRFRLLTAADVLELPRPTWRIKGVLPAQGIGAVYGPPGCGKSFLVLDMAGAIGSGRDWFGHPVERCPVLYLSLEGEHGIVNRVAAYTVRHGELEARFLLESLDVRKPGDRNALIAAIQRERLAGGVLILDTLNRAAPGFDENSPEDMGVVIAALKDLQERLGGLVEAVHHSGKDTSRGLRGHSSLLAALDSVIEVSRDGDRREWRIIKNKDGEDGQGQPFELAVVTIGVDEDGEPITSCVVQPLAAPREQVQRANVPQGGNQKIIWDGLGELLRASKDFGMAGAPPTRPCVRLEDAIQALRGRLACEPNRRTPRARDAITGLVNRGLLVLREGWLWAR